ncbi:MAG: hypothetical protein PHS31_11225 [Victivallaceae bacterium]|nr:hypothetical protein [Victivallaceae bacterium]
MTILHGKYFGLMRALAQRLPPGLIKALRVLLLRSRPLRIGLQSFPTDGLTPCLLCSLMVPMISFLSQDCRTLQVIIHFLLYPIRLS